VFARVITTQATSDGFDSLVRFAREHVPDAQAQPGFQGFYLLTDRDAGNLVTISFWDEEQDVRPPEARAAVLVPPGVEVAPEPAKVYQVEIALPA
jgi:hypothetical protein